MKKSTFFGCKGFVFVFLNVVLFSLLSAADLTVQVIPQGELQPKDMAAEISIIFDQPMVPLGTLQKDVVPDFVALTPVVKGRFYWASDRILMFHPESRLPYATVFQVMIKKDTKSLSESFVPKDLVFRFQTPAPAVVRAETKDRREYKLIWKRDMLRLLFNQPVSRQEVSSKVKLVILAAGFQFSVGYSTDSPDAQAKIQRTLSALQAKGEKAQEIAVAVFEEKNNGIEFIIQPERDLPLNSLVRLTVPTGFKGREGPVPSKKDFTLDFRSPKTFLYGGISCKECKPDYYSTYVAFSNRVEAKSLLANLKVFDITDGKNDEVKYRGDNAQEEYNGYYEYQSPNNFVCVLDSLYYFKAEHRYRLEIQPELQDVYGLTLGMAVKEEFSMLPHSANLYLINSQGIIESSGPKYFSLRVRNIDSVFYKIWALSDEEIPQLLFNREEEKKELSRPPLKSSVLRFKAQRNVSTVVNVNVEKTLGAREGIVFATFQIEDMKEGIEEVENESCQGILQVTDIAISCKHSVQNTLIYCTSFATGKPVADCELKIIDDKGRLAWQGKTDSRGLCLASGLDKMGAPDRVQFIVVAKKGNDRSFLANIWNEGIWEWSFNLTSDEREQSSKSMCYIFSDRGAYRPGEDVYVKAMFRIDKDNQLKLPPPGNIRVKVLDSRDKEIFNREYGLNIFGSASFSFKLPGDIPSGYCRINITPAGGAKEKAIFSHQILIAEFRKPDFRVDVTTKKNDYYPGQNAEGSVRASYLFGAPMKNCPVTWTLRAFPYFFTPKLKGELANQDFIFADLLAERESTGSYVMAEGRGTLDAKGELPVLQSLDFSPHTRQVQLEAEVTDTTQQAIANHTSILLHPSEVYIGLRSGGYFAQKGKDFEMAMVASDISGQLISGRKVKVVLTRREWHSVQEKQEGGYYRYRSEPVDTTVKTIETVSAEKPVKILFPPDQAGYYMVRAAHTDTRGNTIQSSFDFYCIGEGFTPWERYDHNRMDMVPEKVKYNPGQKARILVKSPWTEASGIVTIERTGVIETIPVSLKGSTQVIEIPIKKEYIPTVYVSVLLVKGRTSEKLEGDVDVGKPTFRLGYTKLDITPEEVYLKLSMQSDKEDYRPKDTVKINLKVKDFSGKGKLAEITLYAVDYGVLSLTGYRLPDPVAYFYEERGLGIRNAVSYLTLISRDYLKGKLAEEAGGGGMGDLFEIRKDFRITPFWKGELMTDETGAATASFTLPDFLTTFVVMAVAQTGDSNFGAIKKEIRVSKPLMLFPTLPRFLMVEDRCQGAIRVQNNTAKPGKVTIRAESLSQKIDLEEKEKTIQLEPQGSSVVRFPMKALSLGREKLRFYALMSIDGREEKDAVEVDLPVNRPRLKVDFATYGSTENQETVHLQIPDNIDTDAGGLRLSVSSSALTELEKSSEFLFDYPYGCTEQLTSTLMPFIAMKNLAGAFKFKNYSEKDINAIVNETLAKIYKKQRSDGGFGIWADSRESFPFLTAYVAFVFKMAENKGFAIDRQVRENALKYLRDRFRNQSTNLPYDMCNRAFAVYVLSLYNQTDQSALSLLYEKRQDMPLFAKAMLLQSAARTGSALIRDSLHQDITNAARVTAAEVHFEEGYFNGEQVLMHSSLRSNAFILMALLDAAPDSPFIEKLVTYILNKRKNGAWRNTQENALCLLSLSEYFRIKESREIDFAFKGKIEDKELTAATFKDIRKEIMNVTMSELLKAAKSKQPVVYLGKEGKGRLYWGVNFSYFPLGTDFEEVNQGFSIQRTYEDANSGQKKTNFIVGDLIRIRLRINVTAERIYVALHDPIPAGAEIESAYLKTTSQENLRKSDESSWYFGHSEPYDDRMLAFADRLPQGTHEFIYVIRATSPGSFMIPAVKIEEMYNPEVFGLSKGNRITIE